MGAPNPPTGTNTWDMLNAYRAQLPGLVGQLNNQLPGTATANLRAINNMVNPGSGRNPLGLNALNLQQEQLYAPQEAALQARIAQQNAPIQAALEEQYNPAYRAANAAVNAINLNGLSPGESSAVERSLNQSNTATGNLGLNNPTNTITNAINFGGAFNNKVGMMGQLASGTSGSSGGFNAASPSFGQGNFVQSNYGSSSIPSTNVFGFGSNALGNTTSSNNTMIGSQTSIANQQSIPSYLGAVCCFIFLQSYYGKLPKCVRKGRDKYYKVNHEIAAGYRRMANWLVPLMQINPIIRSLVWNLMVNPITVHLYHPKHNFNKTITHFWLRVWAIIGKGKCEADYCKLIEYVRPI